MLIGVHNKLLCLDSVSYKEWLNIHIRVWVCACSSVAGGAQPFCTITFIPKTENRDVKITSFVNQNRGRTNVTVVLLVILFLTLIVVSFCSLLFLLLIVVFCSLLFLLLILAHILLVDISLANCTWLLANNLLLVFGPVLVDVFLTGLCLFGWLLLILLVDVSLRNFCFHSWLWLSSWRSFLLLIVVSMLGDVFPTDWRYFVDHCLYCRLTLWFRFPRFWF